MSVTRRCCRKNFPQRGVKLSREICMHVHNLILAGAVTTIISSSAMSADCSDAYSNTDDAYNYAKKAYQASSFNELRYYSKKAMSAADDAMSAADDCGCNDAQSNADDTYSYARKAYRSDDFDSAMSYVRRAKSSAEYAMSAAEECGN